MCKCATTLSKKSCKCATTPLNFNFYQWFVGFTDANGQFEILQTKGNIKWSLKFKLIQNIKNYRVLYFIKKNLGFGSITKKSSENLVVYSISKKEHLKKVLDLFDKFPLFAKRVNYQNYYLFKTIYLILERKDLSISEKNNKIDEKLLKGVNKLIYFTSLNLEKSFLTKSWLIGFLETKGRFYLEKKGSTRIIHKFEIIGYDECSFLQTQISKILPYDPKITQSYENLLFISSYFENSFKGIKSLEFNIWSRSLRKNYNFKQLSRTQNLIEKLQEGENKFKV
uniref:LAGLIDADG endonuclease domain-containing protein n=1 Tax=Schizosaccharomyces pombe TaxID=4896 RepID=A0A516IM15_SCHPM|nr:LAGLIDADG endonuclease domain-containing protein [Schizosaccharomyces pombe]